MSSVIFTDQHAPDGRTIRYNLDQSTRALAAKVKEAYEGGDMLEIPNEDGSGEPLFINPDRIATIAPKKEAT